MAAKDKHRTAILSLPDLNLALDSANGDTGPRPAGQRDRQKRLLRGSGDRVTRRAVGLPDGQATSGICGRHERVVSSKSDARPGTEMAASSYESSTGECGASTIAGDVPRLDCHRVPRREADLAIGSEGDSPKEIAELLLEEEPPRRDIPDLEFPQSWLAVK